MTDLKEQSLKKFFPLHLENAGLSPVFHPWCWPWFLLKLWDHLSSHAIGFVTVWWCFDVVKLELYCERELVHQQFFFSFSGKNYTVASKEVNITHERPKRMLVVHFSARLMEFLRLIFCAFLKRNHFTFMLVTDSFLKTLPCLDPKIIYFYASCNLLYKGNWAL